MVENMLREDMVRSQCLWFRFMRPRGYNAQHRSLIDKPCSSPALVTRAGKDPRRLPLLVPPYRSTAPLLTKRYAGDRRCHQIWFPTI